MRLGRGRREAPGPRWHGHRWPKPCAIAAAVLLWLTGLCPAATLVPNGRQQFLSGAGVPLASGQVFMYIPGTSSCKATWSDAAQSVPNSCPIVLDANGEAVIYGAGTYRQLVEDSLGNIIWDQPTADTSATAPIWGGTASGTANVITVTAPSFASVDGSILQFLATQSNTGAATLNGIAILRDTAAGAVALTGGEIIGTNIASLTYSSSGNSFHMLNPVTTTAPGTSTPLCGAVGLIITNNTLTPNSQINVNADTALMTSIAGNAIFRSTINLTINATVNGANGLDVGTFAASQWYNIYLIDNGTAPAALASLSATSPTLPSGYLYKCRLGAMQTSGAIELFRTKQVGSKAAYTPVAATNTPHMPQLSAGAQVWPVTTSLATFIPPTATRVNIMASADITGGTIYVAPNSSGCTNVIGGAAQTQCPIAAANGGAGVMVMANADLVLEGANVFIGATSANSRSFVYGWTDKVNAQ